MPPELDLILSGGAPIGGTAVSAPTPMLGSGTDEEAVGAAAEQLGFQPEWLSRAISFESRGGDPQAVNPYSGATGLIQFTDDTARNMGYRSAADLAVKNPDFRGQLFNAVVPYFEPYKDLVKSEEDLLLAVFYPAALKNPALRHKELPLKARIQNPGIRTPQDYVDKVMGREPGKLTGGTQSLDDILGGGTVKYRPAPGLFSGIGEAPPEKPVEAAGEPEAVQAIGAPSPQDMIPETTVALTAEEYADTPQLEAEEVARDVTEALQVVRGRRERIGVEGEGPKLPWWEAFSSGDVVEAYKRGDANSALDMLAYDVMVGRLSWGDAEPQIAEFEKRAAKDPLGAYGWLGQGIVSVSAMLPAMVKGRIEGVAMGEAGAIGAGAAGMLGGPTAPITVPAAAALGFAVGNSFGATDYWRRLGAGQMFRDMMGRGVKQETATLLAHIGSVPYALIEQSQVERLIPGADKALQRIISNSLVRTMAKGTLKYAGEVGSETLEEGFQGAVDQTVQEAAEYLEGRLKAENLPESAGRVTQKFLSDMRESLVALALLMAPRGARRMGAAARQFSFEEEGRQIEQEEAVPKAKKGEEARRSLADVLLDQMREQLPPSPEGVEVATLEPGEVEAAGWEGEPTPIGGAVGMRSAEARRRIAALEGVEDIMLAPKMDVQPAETAVEPEVVSRETLPPEPVPAPEPEKPAEPEAPKAKPVVAPEPIPAEPEPTPAPEPEKPVAAPATLTKEAAKEAYFGDKLIRWAPDSGVEDKGPMKIAHMEGRENRIRPEGWGGHFDPSDFVLAEPEAPPKKPAEAPPPAEKYNQATGLVDDVQKSLASGASIDNPALTQMAEKAFGGTRGQGAYDVRDSYDAMEAAVNVHIEESKAVDFNDPSGTVDRLVEITNRLPRQADRTQEQVELQQFSTPPAEAFVAAYASGAKEGMTVLEPSAGTGNLATMARIKGADVVVNEIDPRRLDMLNYQGFKKRHEVNAEQLNNLLPDDVQPDVVIMNPPFSATGGRVAAHKTTFGAKHVTEALARLKDGGRLVAIVGRGMGHERPGFSKWWDGIEKKFNVRANVGIAGKHYGKYGTGFDNQIIVIDKTGPTPGENRAERVTNIVRGKDLAPADALGLLEGIAKEDVYGRIERPAERPVETTAEGVRREPGAEREPVTGPDERVAEGRERVREPTGRRGGADRQPVGGVVEPEGKQPEPVGGRAVEGGREGEGIAPTEGGAAETGVGREPGGVVAERAGRPAGPERIEEEAAGVYAKYRVQKARFKGSQKHPADIVESATLASVEPPRVKYEPQIPEEVISEGRLSDVQMEAVTYAGQRHEQRLPDGQRAEYWVGDGTGVGKGREIAGIIYDQLQRGKKKAVWVSISKDLLPDARRDMEGVGVPLKVFAQNDYKADGSMTQDQGVLFTQYTLLRGNWKADKKRFKQLTDWLGPDFDGVIVFDESHQMKNAVQNAFGSDKATEGTNQGAMGLELKAAFPNARFVNVSATAATTATNLGYMSRMGLWGPGAPFRDFMGFANAMKKGGVGAMEMLSRDLKAVGAYISRAISYEGVEYGKVEHVLTPEETAQYDKIADLWSNLLQSFDEASEGAGQSGHARGRKFSQFYSTQQRFFLQYMMGLQLPDVLSDADQDLKEGRSVVISLYNTNESTTRDKIAQAMAEGIDLADIDITPKDMIVEMIRRHFPTEQYHEVSDPVTGATKKVPVTDAAGNPVLNKENLAKQQQLIETVSTIRMPGNPLDTIVNHFGPSKVAEITGRKTRIEGGKAVPRKIKGVPQKRLNEYEIRAFQEGSKRVTVISGAASTGISLHSDVKAKNQQQRVFYALQLSWSADQQMQSFGRVHRSFQKAAPSIKLVRTNLAGQKRLENTTSKRLASLGAISTGTREGYAGSLFEMEDITDPHGEAALKWLYDRVAREDVSVLDRMGILDGDGNVKKGRDTDVEGFLNRIMALPVEQQNGLFERFYDKYREIVDREMAAGTFDVGVKKIPATDMRLLKEPETVYTHEQSGAETKLVELEGMVPTERMSTEKASAIAAEGDGFWRNKKSGKVYAKAVPSEHLKMMGEARLRNPRGAYLTADEAQIDDRYERMDDDEGRKQWTDELAAIPETEARKYNLLTGAIFPIYDKIFGGGGKMKSGVRRAVLEDGSGYIGIEIKQKDIAGVRQRLGIGTPLGKASPREIYDLVWNNLSVVELDNGWRVRRSRVHGDERLELVYSTSAPNADEMRSTGLFDETINWNKRYFVPSGTDDAVPVLEKLFKNHKPVRDITAGDPPIANFEESQALSAQQWDIELPRERQLPPKAPGTNKTKIIRFVERTFGMPVRSRATHKWKDVGRYYPHKVIARMKRWGDLWPLMHEVAHHIDAQIKKRLGTNWKGKSAALSELRDLDYDPGKGRTSEGFAEFVRHWLSTGEAREHAPAFGQYFDNTILEGDPALRQNLEELRDLLDTWKGMGSLDRMIAQIDVRGEHTKPEGTAAKAGLVRNWMTQRWVDSLDAIQRVNRMLGLRRRRNIRPTQDPYEMAEYMKAKAAGVVRTFVYDKAIDEYGNVLGPGLMDVLKPITPKDRVTWQEVVSGAYQEKMRKFLAYGAAKRAKWLAGRGIESGFDMGDVNHVLQTYSNPEWDKAVEGITEWSNNLIKWLVSAGSLSAEEARVMRELNPVYLPFKRAFLEELTAIKGVGGGAGGGVDSGKGIHRMKGSTRPIVNPIESLVQQATAIIQKAHKVHIARLFADLAEREGAGGFITRVPAPMEATRVSTQQVIGALKKEGFEVEDADVDKLLTVFTQAWKYQGKDNIIALWRNGKREFFEVHPEVYRALMSMDMGKRNAIVRVLAPFARMVRLGATGLSPTFALAKNPWRDAFTYSVFSKSGIANPLDIVTKLPEVISPKEGSLLWRYQAVGGSLAGVMGYDRATTVRVYDELLAKNLKKGHRALWIAKHPWMLLDYMRDFMSVFEMAPRSAEMDRMYNRYRKKHPDWSEEDAFVAAFNDAQDVTINFTRGGEWAKRVNEVSAFFNVAIQGPNKVYRSFREDPVMTTLKGLEWLTLPALMMWLRNRDKEWYKNLPPEYKYTNFFFEMGSNVYRLPIPFDLGVIFCSIPWALMDQDPEGAKAVGKILQRNFPDPTPTAMVPIFDIWRNQNFLGRPIENEKLKHLPVTERTKSYTTGMAIAASKGLKGFGVELSPIQIDYLLNSYTGGFARNLPLKKIKEIEDVPVIGALMVKMPENPRRQLNRFFDDYVDLSQKNAVEKATPEERSRLRELRGFYTAWTKMFSPALAKNRDDRERVNEIYGDVKEALKRRGYE